MAFCEGTALPFQFTSVLPRRAPSVQPTVYVKISIPPNVDTSATAAFIRTNIEPNRRHRRDIPVKLITDRRLDSRRDLRDVGVDARQDETIKKRNCEMQSTESLHSSLSLSLWISSARINKMNDSALNFVNVANSEDACENATSKRAVEYAYAAAFT